MALGVMAVGFDLDGTLFDHRVLRTQSVRHWLDDRDGSRPGPAARPTNGCA